MKGWSRQEASTYLSLHLKGEALHYFEQLSERVKEDLELARKAMERRFVQKATTEAQKAAFHNLFQKEQEPLKEFADRVRETAQEAFPGLPTAYVEVEMVNRFLKGILAKDAGLYALNNRYENLEKAIEAVQVSVENRSAFGQMKIGAVEDLGSSQEEDIARVRFQRKQGPTQERSTTVPIAPVSNTEGMEEVKKTLRDIQNARNIAYSEPSL